MTFLLNCVIQVTVVLSIALTSLSLLRKRSAALRHCVLSTAILFSILMPAFNLLVPVWNLNEVVSRHSNISPIREQLSAWTSPAMRTPTRHLPVADTTPESTEARRSSAGSDIVRRLPQMLLWLWATGVAIGVIVLVTGFFRLARVVSLSVPMPNGPWRRLTDSISNEYGLKKIVHLLESRNPSVLVTWGALRPRVVLPAGSAKWSEPRVRIVLRHELAHIRRGDWIVQLFAQTLRIVYWFNPLVWIVCRRLRLESECACDDAVLSCDIEGPEYAEHLLDLARVLNRSGQSWSAAVSMARPCTIERRFLAMLNPRLNRYPVTRTAMFATSLVGLAIALFVSSASTATPIQSIPEEPKTASTEKAGAPVRVDPEPIPIAKPAPIEPRAVSSTAQIAPTESDRIELSRRSETLRNLYQKLEMDYRQNLFAAGTGTVQRRRGNALDRALLEVAEDGDVSDIEDLLRAGANVNAVILGDGTPLIAAAGDGRLEAVRYLLDRGADPNLPASGDGNPLIAAAREGHLDVVRLLLDRGADPNGAVVGDGNALIMAAREGHADIVTFLLDRGANIDQIVPGDENALIGASAEGQLNVVRLLVSRHADVNARVWVEPNPSRPNGEWRTALSEARREGHQEIVQFLLSVGARE